VKCAVAPRHASLFGGAPQQQLRQLGEVHGNPPRLVAGALPAPRFRRAAAIDSAVSTLTPKKVSQ